MHQYDAVIQVMEENGGYATLKQLYEKTDVTDWATKTPNASIRRIVQQRDEIFKIRPGLWALEAYRDDLPEHVYDEDASEQQQQHYSHTYFQGLLTQIGNLRSQDTWVPAQDKNQQFLDTVLADVRSLETIPAFSYETLVGRAQTVDVIWFNERRMPSNLFEVEFSTDFQNSLHKFLDLQDFYAQFFIVADSDRKQQYVKRLNQAGFEPIKDRVNFMSFKDVSTLHAAEEQSQEQVGRLRI